MTPKKPHLVGGNGGGMYITCEQYEEYAKGQLLRYQQRIRELEDLLRELESRSNPDPVKKGDKEAWKSHWVGLSKCRARVRAVLERGKP